MAKSSKHYEQLYEMLLGAIPSSVLLIDRNMRIVSANQNFLEKSQRYISNTIGFRLEDVFPSVILNHTNIAHRISQAFIEKRPTKGEQMNYRTPGIPMRTYYYSIHPLLKNDVVEVAMLLMNDVTEQIQLSEEVRRVERHLASIVESASDIVISADSEGKILTWNTAAEKLSNHTFNDVRGKFFFEYCDPKYHEEAKIVFSKIKSEKNSQMGEWELTTKHGKRIPVSWVCSPMKDGHSQIMGVVAVGRDLTERRKFETQLFQSQKLAALGVMAGGIAHEVRNPLAICLSATQFLMEDDIRPEFRKNCHDKIYGGIQKASNIIENLLRFSRPSMSTEKQEIALFPIIQETLILITNQARIQKIEMRSKLPPEDVLINGIASLLQQVLMNLCLNAISSMPNGGILDVSLEKTDSAVLIHIADTGQGISNMDINNVFDPFYTTSPVGKGTGLGLSICYSIIQQHSGSIEVNSVEGTGSTFTITLPCL